MSVKRFVSHVGLLCLLLQFSHASNVVADGGLTPWGTSDYLCASGGFGRDIEFYIWIFCIWNFSYSWTRL